jgi:K+ transporter
LSEVFDLGYDTYAINARYGFVENPDIRALLRELEESKLIPYNISRCTISAPDEDILLDQGGTFWWKVRTRCFKFVYALAVPAFRYFGLDADTNLSLELIPIHFSPTGSSVIRISNDDVMI